jgi:hypothetical protein
MAITAASATAATVPGVTDFTVGNARSVDPVVLKGDALAGWAVPANQTARLPLVDLICWGGGDGSVPDPTTGGGSDLGNLGDNSQCPHSHYAEPDADTSTIAAPEGFPVDRLLGYGYDAGKGTFVQIPFQADEVFTRYLNNEASGFSIYSGEDQHTTYAYDRPGDREGFRYTKDSDDPSSCVAQPESPAASDPVKGLDTNDEIAFMASDAGPQAPLGTRIPAGILAVKEIRVDDPLILNAKAQYVYIMQAAADGPKPAFTAANGYVDYKRDANADTFAFSESSYDSYGNAPAGRYCDANGNVVRNADGTPKIGQRRPRDGATIKTRRYQYRYDGRWLMTKVQISPDAGKTYGPDLVDRWKARAFAQDPGSETPCCGYEEEETNWGGSSILLGEHVGPVRAVRETWGADSGTNVIRRETFYRDAMRQKTWLRVHVIPPLDGIYAQWDFNAGAVDTFYNSRNPGGIKIDGHNDEAYGNFDDPCDPRYDGNDTSAFDQQYRDLYRELEFCGNFPYHQSIDPGDPTFADANAALGWSQVSGASGTIVDRITTQPGEMPAGGAAQAMAAVPYYRDDSCFDDGTGSNPGPKLRPRSTNEPAVAADGTARKCWTPADGAPNDSDHFYQGSIGTHGVHLLFLADSDNARQTVPVTEIIQDWAMVMIPGNPGNVGEKYGRSLEKPLLTVPADRPDMTIPNGGSPIG